MKKIIILVLALTSTAALANPRCHSIANATMAGYDMSRAGESMFEMLAKHIHDTDDEDVKAWKRVFIRAGYEMHEAGMSQSAAYRHSYEACLSALRERGV